MTTKLCRENGVLKIRIDDQVYEPLSFKSFRPTERNISDFHKAGLRLFTILSSGLHSILGVPYSLYGESWLGVGEYDFSVIDKQIDLFIKSAPEGYFALMIQLDTRDWWLQSHENYPNSFTHLSQMASDSAWRRAAGDYMQAVLTHVEEKYGERMFGYFLLCGTTTEWFSDRDYEATHPLKEAAYRRYTGDDGVSIPREEALVLPKDISFVEDENVRRYRQFHAEQTADTILYFAARAQEILRHNKLLGLYFGYLFELGGPRLWNAGHLAYEKVFESPDIDMISSPSSYGYRGKDATSAFMVTYKTLDIHDKLYYLEFDHITHVAPSHVDGFLIPGGNDKCKDQTETLNLMERDFLLCVANGASLWWFDMFEGWFYSDEMMEAIRKMIELSKVIGKLPRESAAEIAVIASGESLYGVSKNAGINDKLLGAQRNGLARMGAPYDVYTQGDLSQIDFTPYKLVIFLDAFTLDEGGEGVVSSLKEAGKTLLWLYAPGYGDGGLAKLCRLTDMTVAVLPTMPTGVEGDTGVILSKPHFHVADHTAIPLTRYNTGETAVAWRRTETNISVYSALGNLSGPFLRQIAQLAGVHIYGEKNPVYVNRCLVGTYAMVDEVLHVREDGTYTELFSGKTYVAKDGRLPVETGERRCRLFVPTRYLQ